VLAATLRLFPQGSGLWRIGRVVSHPDFRGKRMGDLVMRMALQKAQDMGALQICLDAQLPVVGFYARYGFRPSGDLIYDEGQPHQPMRVDADKIDWARACGGH
jgi:ElaA protein